MPYRVGITVALYSLMTIRVSHNINDLTGQGPEYLLDANGEAIAYFYDGSFVSADGVGFNEGETVTAV